MDLTDEEVADEVRLIERHEGWPYWPVLPMKNMHRGEPDCPEDEEHGVVIAESFENVFTGKFKVRLVSAFELKDKLEGARVLEFDSIEAAVRAGWIGD